jgi:hypothetical protein
VAEPRLSFRCLSPVPHPAETALAMTRLAPLPSALPTALPNALFWALTWALLATTALLLGGCAGNKTRFIEPTTVELGHAPGPRSHELGEDGYLQVQVSSNLGEDAERLKFYGEDAPKLIVVTAKLQPLAGPGRDQPAPEVPLLSYDVAKGSSEDLTARTLAGGIVVKAGSLSGAATLTLIVRGITASGASTLGPLMETIKKTPAAITGVATLLGGVPITAFQTFVVPMLEKSAAETHHQWERKKEYTFQVGETLDALDGRVVAFLMLTEDRKGGFTIDAELCSIEVEQPKLCRAQPPVAGKPVTTPYLLFDLHVSDYRPIDDLVAQGGPCATDRAVLAKTAEVLASGAMTGRQAFLEDLLLKRRIVLADIRDSGGSNDRLSRAAWRYQRLSTPEPGHARHAYWQQYFAGRAARVDACIDDALATATPTTRRTWATLLDGFRAIDEVDAAVARNADTEAPEAAEAAALEVLLRRLDTAESVPAIDAESRAWLVNGISQAQALLDHWYRAEVLRITGATDSPEAATRQLKKLIARSRCPVCVGTVNTALTALAAGASVRSTEAAVKREGVVLDALKTRATVDAAESLGEGAAGSARAADIAIDRSLAVDPAKPGAGAQIEQLQQQVDRQRERAEAAMEPPPSDPPPATP